MHNSIGTLNNNGKSFMYKLSSISIFLYIICAVAFELTAGTAIFSTLAIYVVFLVGFFYLIQGNAAVINEYVILTVLFCLFVLVRNMSQGASQTMGMQIAYWEFTCSVLCLLTFWMTVKYPEMIDLLLIAYIIGAVVLSYRVVSEYGGINQMIEFASSEGEHRVGGLLGNANAIGLSLANGVLCCLFFLTKKKGALLKTITIITLIVLATMLLLTGSRKSTVFMLAGFVFFLVMYNRKNNIFKKLIMYILVIAVIFAVFNIIRNVPMFSTLSERFELLFDGFGSEGVSYETDETRKEMVSFGLAAFENKPVFGNGTGHSYKLFNTYSHNNFVELLMNYGIVGFFLHYLIYAVIIVRLFKKACTRDARAIYFLVYICVQMVLGIGWVNYYERPVKLITSKAFGYLAGVERTEGKALNENNQFV